MTHFLFHFRLCSLWWWYWWWWLNWTRRRRCGWGQNPYLLVQLYIWMEAWQEEVVGNQKRVLHFRGIYVWFDMGLHIKATERRGSSVVAVLVDGQDKDRNGKAKKRRATWKLSTWTQWSAKGIQGGIYFLLFLSRREWRETTMSFKQPENEKWNYRVNIEGYLCFIYCHLRRGVPMKNSSTFLRFFCRRRVYSLISSPEGSSLGTNQCHAFLRVSSRPPFCNVSWGRLG